MEVFQLIDVRWLISLLLTMNGLGNVPVFASVLKDLPEHRRKFVAFRDCFAALVAMLLFFFCGRFIFTHLGISDPAVKLAGGVLLFSVSMQLLFPKPGSSVAQMFGIKRGEEPFLVPLGIPMFAGPGTLANVLVFSEASANHCTGAATLLLAWGMSALLLIFSSSIEKVIPDYVMKLLERLIGLILLMVSMEMIGTGFKLIIG